MDFPKNIVIRTNKRGFFKEDFLEELLASKGGSLKKTFQEQWIYKRPIDLQTLIFLIMRIFFSFCSPKLKSRYILIFY